MRLRAVAIAGLALTAASIARAQVVTIPGLFSTGVDASGNPLAPNSIDPHYTIVGTDAGPAVVINQGGQCRFPTYYAPFNSCWIWENANGLPVNVTRIFRLFIDLTGLDASTAQITGQWGTDNFGDDIFINGISTGQTNPGFLVPKSFSVTSGFVAGMNTLDFKVRDVGGISAVDVQNMTGTARKLAVAGVPEPGTYVMMGTGLLALAGFRVRRRTR